MRILVTGGLGFIGCNFCRYILSSYRDYKIINVDKLGIGSNLENLKDLKGDKRYKFIKGDICNKNLVNGLIKDVDAVVHIAAETHVDRSIKSPGKFIKNNTIGTFTLLEAIRKHNNCARLLHVSTDEVYGQAVWGSFDEHGTLRPSNPYSASKVAADMFVIAYNKTYQLDVIITRCTNNFGPYQHPEKLIPKTIIRSLRNMPVPLYGSGKNIRDWIYVIDHCEALALVLEKGKSGEIYNISAENELPNIEIVRRILRILNKPENFVTFVDDRPGHDFRYSLNSSKIRGELGWKPKFTLDEALRETVSWYIKNEQWWRPLATERALCEMPWRHGKSE